MNLFRNIFLACLFILPLVNIISNNNANFYAQAVEDDPVEGEDSDVNVESGDVTKTEDDDDTAGLSEGYKNSPDADITYLFTKPAGSGMELPAGKEVNLLVGFLNKGKKDFYVDTMVASFRYSADFNYYLQNFTTFGYYRTVKPKQEVTLNYQFFVSDAYTPRPYGLTVDLHYRDADNNQYLTAVFNETVNVVELDEGLDSETFFLFIVLGGLAVLALVGIYQLFQSYGKKHIPMPTSSKPKFETGTSNHEDVDYDWLPKQTIKQLNKSPNPAKPSSPRQRRANKKE